VRGPSLDRAAREGIVAAAIRGRDENLRAASENGPGKELWGEAIARLKPLRVRDDRVNTFIVLKEDETTEEGLYVFNPLSSYAPGMDKQRFVVFEVRTQTGDEGLGFLYYCKIRKAPPEPAAAGIQSVGSGTNRPSGPAASRR
jgi:hypothetical protein